MQEIFTLIDRNWSLLCMLAALMFVGKFAWLCYERVRDGIEFPELKAGEFLFHEGMASGSSCKNWWTRMGGANNCLRVTVTADEVWVRTFFPFSLLAGEMDLEHRIARRAITKAELVPGVFRSWVRLEFRLADGSVRELKLRLRSPEEFLEALRRTKAQG
jgi:hypothetical protein